METRKVQTVGGGTYTVSVPKEWARRQNLQTGETVRLYSHRDGSLIVRGSQRDGETLQSVSVPVEATVGAAERSIRAAYEGGFERIELLPEDSLSDEQRRAIRTVTRDLVGSELVESEPMKIVVRAMLDASAVSIRQSIDQAVSVLTSMQRTAIEGLTTGDAVADHLRSRRPDVDRQVALVRRHYNRSLASFEELDALGIDRVPLSRYNRTADRIEQLAVTTVRLAEAIERGSLTDEQARVVADRLTTLATALEDAIARVLDGTEASGVRADRLATGSRADTTDGLTAEGYTDATLSRIADLLACLEEHVRTIERIGTQSAIHHRARS